MGYLIQILDYNMSFNTGLLLAVPTKLGSILFRILRLKHVLKRLNAALTTLSQAIIMCLYM